MLVAALGSIRRAVGLLSTTGVGWLAGMAATVAAAWRSLVRRCWRSRSWRSASSLVARRAGAVDGLVEIVTQGWRLWHQTAGLAQRLRGAVQIALLQRFAAMLHISLGQLALVLLQACVAAGALLQRAELAARVVETFFGKAQVELTEGDDQIVDRREAVLLAALATGQK